MQHAWTIGADVLAEEEHEIGFLEVFESHGSDAHADRFLQSDARALVTHVRTVGQIVGAVHACKKLVHVGRFQRCATGCIERDALRIEPAQLAADVLEGFFPADAHVLVGGGVIAQRRGETPGVFEVVIVPRAEFRHRVKLEELRCHALRGEIPRGCLRAAFAEFEGVRIGGLRPRAAHAREAFRFVLLEQHRAELERHFLVNERARDGLDRSPSTR